MSDIASLDLDALATPVAWLGVDTRLTSCNAAFARWLGVGQRRLLGFRLDELDAEAGRLSALLSRLTTSGEPLRVHRARLAFPGGAEHFADLWLAREESGATRLEADRKSVV